MQLSEAEIGALLDGAARVIETVVKEVRGALSGDVTPAVAEERIKAMLAARDANNRKIDEEIAALKASASAAASKRQHTCQHGTTCTGEEE